MDIVCFFRFEKVDFVLSILELDCVNVVVVMREFEEKCLVIILYNWFEMYDLMYVMGREIGSELFIRRVGKCSRLWNYKDICYVLE